MNQTVINNFLCYYFLTPTVKNLTLYRVNMNILPSNQLGVGAPDEKDPTQKFKVAGHDCKSQEESPPPKRRKNDMLQLYGGRIIRSTGTKDRHSKICTARGPRDRRLRLSPKTAISFYDVQERLGYDRPSKAIDWLIKEAKSAIDALDQPPPPASNVHANSQHMLKTEIGIITEHFNNDDPISSFGFITHASTSEDRTPPEIFDTNLEIARLQRIFSWNYNSCVSPLPPPVDLGHGYTFTDREPLQSRIYNYSPQFPAVNFSNEELLNFTGAATFKEEDDKDIIPVSTKSSTIASFLH